MEKRGSDAALTKEALRGLIDRFVLHPNAETGKLSVELGVALTGLLALADPIGALGDAKRVLGVSPKTQCIDTIEDLVLVAGA